MHSTVPLAAFQTELYYSRQNVCLNVLSGVCTCNTLVFVFGNL